MLEKEFWSLHMAAQTYRNGQKYYGTFPEGFIKRIEQRWGSGFIIQPFAGTSKYGLTIDLNREIRPSIVADGSMLPVKEDTADLVLVDMPYDDEAHRKYGSKPLKIHTALDEATRVCRAGGHIAFLHFITPRKPKGTERVALIAISTGPDRRIRALSVFRKLYTEDKR